MEEAHPGDSTRQLCFAFLILIGSRSDRPPREEEEGGEGMSSKPQPGRRFLVRARDRAGFVAVAVAHPGVGTRLL